MDLESGIKDCSHISKALGLNKQMKNTFIETDVKQVKEPYGKKTKLEPKLSESKTM